jgi:type II secretory pathway predicted ATPase ExeA/HSP20 family molecular chaperone IbpA
MFLDFYALSEQPFGVTPDPAYLYLSRTHSHVLAALQSGIQADRGFMALIAESGMGKTTLLYRLIEELHDSARTVFLFQTQCDSREFFGYVLSELGIETSGMDIASMHKKLNEVLFSEMLAGRRFVLIVDEAHNLEAPVLETIRLLSDFETTHSKLVEIVLAGQPLLAKKLARPGLAQLRQRIAILNRLERLGAEETACYIEHRLKIAGYSGDALFTPEALAVVAKQNQGIPRKINNICFNALLLGEARKERTISAEIAQEAGEYQVIHTEAAREPRAKGEPATVAVSSGDDCAELAQQINERIARRAYELFESSGFRHGHDREDRLRAESEILVHVPVDITETESELIIRAEVPRFDGKDLQVRVAPRSLCIIGQRRESTERQEGRVVYSERSAPQILRLLELPSEINPDKVTAKVSGSLLVIKSPLTPGTPRMR